MTRKILVPIDFSPCSDAALRHALTIADENGAEVEILYVWRVEQADAKRNTAIFADTPQGVAMEERLTAAESDHAARICGRLEFGDEPSRVILEILERERFDMVVMGLEGEGRKESSGPASGHVAASVVHSARCKVITTPPPAPLPAKIVAA